MPNLLPTENDWNDNDAIDAPEERRIELADNFTTKLYNKVNTYKGAFTIGDSVVMITEGKYQGIEGKIINIRIVNNEYVELFCRWNAFRHDLDYWHPISSVDLMTTKVEKKIELNRVSENMEDLIGRMRKGRNKNLYFENLLSEMR